MIIGHAKLQTYQTEHNRWKGVPATHPLNDYQALVVYLTSEEADVSIEDRRRRKQGLSSLTHIKTKLEKVIAIWESIISHRKIRVSPGCISVYPIERQAEIEELFASDRANTVTEYEYNASEMSDGERVIFYLIGQCLVAPENGLIIIDEPELHLHKSIQQTLWSKIEAARPDLGFIYITHDLGFAAEKQNARKIWVKSYNGQNWD